MQLNVYYCSAPICWIQHAVPSSPSTKNRADRPRARLKSVRFLKGRAASSPDSDNDSISALVLGFAESCLLQPLLEGLTTTTKLSDLGLLTPPDVVSPLSSDLNRSRSFSTRRGLSPSESDCLLSSSCPMTGCSEEPAGSELSDVCSVATAVAFDGSPTRSW